MYLMGKKAKKKRKKNEETKTEQKGKEIEMKIVICVASSKAFILLYCTILERWLMYTLLNGMEWNGIKCSEQTQILHSN